MIIGQKDIDTNAVNIVGILNVTPDSFSDGGCYNVVDSAVSRALQLASYGAAIIDIGGESTRPGYEPVDEKNEILRVVPVIEKLREKSDIPISVDTSKSNVAIAAIKAGADMINDVTGLKGDASMAKVIAEYNVPVCIMYNGNGDICKHLLDSVELAKKNGIKDDKIILDPGIGFGKTHLENLTIIKNIDKVVALGYPVFLGVSRKSVIGFALDLPVTQREEATIALSVYAGMKGCSFLRVHDVEKNYRAIKMISIVEGMGDCFGSDKNK